MADLFETPEKLPVPVQEVLNKHSEDWDDSYEKCQALENDLKPLGYTFDWYLDAQPFNLRKI